MSYKRIESVRDLIRFRQCLYLHCRCGRDRRIHPWQLTMWCKAVGWPEDLRKLVKRFRCSACGGIPQIASCDGPADFDLGELARTRIAAIEAKADRLRVMLRDDPIEPPAGRCPRCGRGGEPKPEPS